MPCSGMVRWCVMAGHVQGVPRDQEPQRGWPAGGCSSLRLDSSRQQLPLGLLMVGSILDEQLIPLTCENTVAVGCCQGAAEDSGSSCKGAVGCRLIDAVGRVM